MLKIENVRIKLPMLENDVEPMFPSDARERNLTYSGKIIVKVTQLVKIININGLKQIKRKHN